ncbi:hypothetical protein CEXT_418521 [Caerostris extrusa]|uniref:Uncharacterized protein n=1 Tax=Caerostris extrusa TaxID=172846 RepID=A0AAV4VKQ1_CAEEX|nr:hypothetical protein CEXT_418521 [Caerostris extrusa]
MLESIKRSRRPKNFTMGSGHLFFTGLIALEIDSWDLFNLFVEGHKIDCFRFVNNDTKHSCNGASGEKKEESCQLPNEEGYLERETFRQTTITFHLDKRKRIQQGFHCLPPPLTTPTPDFHSLVFFFRRVLDYDMTKCPSDDFKWRMVEVHQAFEGGGGGEDSGNVLRG